MSSVVELKNRYNTKSIHNLETLIIEVSKILESNVDDVYENLKDIAGVTLKSIQNIIDAYSLLMRGNKVELELKNLINQERFIDQNPTFISSLSKIYFHADVIRLEGDNVVVKKEILLPKIVENNIPEIKAEKVISQVLKKLKYDRFLPKDLESIQQIGSFREYRELHDLLINAIDQQYLIRQLRDEELAMDLTELKVYLSQ